MPPKARYRRDSLHCSSFGPTDFLFRLDDYELLSRDVDQTSSEEYGVQAGVG
jgi:hypothetical protein